MDHILPRVRGGRDNKENLKPAHAVCNNMREHAGDCIGALACAVAVAESDKSKKPNGKPRSLSKRTRQVLKEWKLMHQPREQKERQIRAALAFYPNTCNELYMGSMARCNVHMMLRVAYPCGDIDAAIRNADDALFDELYEYVRPYIEAMKKVKN